MDSGLGAVAAVVAVVALAAVPVPSMGLVELPLMLLALLFYVSVPVAVIALGVWLALRLLPQLRIQSTAGGDLGESAVEILKQQYARGKITRDQYLQMRQDLQS